MPERGGVRRHAGHRAAERADLGDGHHRRRRGHPVEDGRRRLLVEVIGEPRLPHRIRVVVLLVRHIDLGVRHRAEHVGQRLGESAERSHRLFARVRVSRVRHEREDRELALVLLGDERHRRRLHHVRDRRQLFGGRLRLLDERCDHLRRGGQYQTCGVIEKEVRGELKEHRFIRAETHSSREEAVAFSIAKAQQLIDEQGERLFG